MSSVLTVFFSDYCGEDIWEWSSNNHISAASLKQSKRKSEALQTVLLPSANKANLTEQDGYNTIHRSLDLRVGEVWYKDL